MRTNIEIDDALMAEALTRSGLSTKRAMIARLLEDYVIIERQKEALEGLRGLGWDGDPIDVMRTEKPLEWG